MEEYVLQAPITGDVFRTDSAEVHTYITKLTAGNSTAEAKIQGSITEKDGRVDYVALKIHYRGIGINSIDILKADQILESLFYSGEKKPHMW